MRGKTKKFLSLLTAGAIIMSQIPSAFADDPQATPSRMTASYPREEYVGTFINASDVTATLYDDENREIETTNSVEMADQTVTPQVLNKGNNEFPVRHKIGTDENNQPIFLSAVLNVWGYVEESISANYSSSSHYKVGETASKSDINVRLNYSEHKDGSANFDYVDTKDFDVSDLTLTKVGDNPVEVTYKTPHGNTFTTTVNIPAYEERLVATYKGDPVEVGEDFDEDKVEVKVIEDYGNNNEYSYSTNWNTASKTVTKKGANEFTLTTDHGNVTLVVQGYEDEPATITGIEAKYTGKDVRVDVAKATDRYVNAKNVEITVKYSDGTSTNVGSVCTVEGVENHTAPEVKKVGSNTFKAVYTVDGKSYSDEFVVWGYELDHISAKYTGEKIRTQEDYDKKDVDVKAYWSERKDGTSTEFTPSSFDVNSTKVEKVGDNTFTATYENKTADFVVEGFDDRVYEKSMEAKYVGPDILVGNTFKSSDVEVVVTYTDGSQKTIKNGFEITPFKEGVGPVVIKNGWNEFEVSYNDMTAKIKVWGYSPESINAEYVGPDVLVDNQFYSKDVNVELVYSPYSDGTVKKETLKADQYTLVNSDNRPNPTVTDVKWNTYTVTYDGMSDTIKVWGYKLDKLEAVYNGPSIYVDNNYDKKDVKVTATYTPFSDGKVQVIDVKEFDVDSLLVKKVGANTYTATCEYGKAPFTVPGIEKVVTTENVFEIVALDRDANKVNGVEVKYSTNGVKGTLKTGSTTSAKIGVGTVITVDDCTITVPEGYKLYTSTLGASKSDTNTTYTLTIVVEKQAEPVKKTPNVLKLVAVDASGNVVNGVTLDYVKDAYKGTLKTGTMDTVEVGTGVVITLDNCTIGIPADYVIKDKSIKEASDASHTVYTVTVVLDKKPAAQPTNTQPSNTTPASTTPQTGDESNAMLYMLIGGIAIIALLGLLVAKKKDDKEVSDN